MNLLDSHRMRVRRSWIGVYVDAIDPVAGYTAATVRKPRTKHPQRR